jgi:hypothetical protein
MVYIVDTSGTQSCGKVSKYLKDFPIFNLGKRLRLNFKFGQIRTSNILMKTDG